MKHKYQIGGTAITVVWTIIFLGIWTLGTNYSLPPILDIPKALMRLITEEGLLYELGVSLKLNFEAVLISTIISVGFSYLTVTEKWRQPIVAISKFRFFGMAGFVIVFQRMFTDGHALKLAMLVFSMSAFFITSMIDVNMSASKAEFDHARSLRMGRLRSVYEVVILGKADEAFNALRQNAAIGWMMLTMVEGLTKAEGGVGVIMLNESKYRSLDAVFALQFLILLIGVFQDKAIAWLKNICCPYACLTLEHK